MRRVAGLLATIAWVLFLASVFAGTNNDAGDTAFETHYIFAAETILGAAGFVFSVIAAKPSGTNFSHWLSPRPGSVPIAGWVAVAGPAFVGALFAPDPNVRLAFAIFFGLITIVVGIAAACLWAIPRRASKSPTESAASASEREQVEASS
jgi:hypothetical protein